MNDEDGALLLKALDVARGGDEERRKASLEMGGHALALVLLGRMLARKFDGDVRRRDELPRLLDAHGGHARRVMQWYDGRWQEERAPERTFLQILGLFGRRMEKNELLILVNSGTPAVQPLASLDEGQWNEMILDLMDLGLLERRRKEEDSPQWDTHPLVREYFGEQLRKGDPDGWREAHRVLFEHFARTPTEHERASPDALLPLYRAVRHGCLAGKYKEAYEIYRYRVARDHEGFDTERLGLTMQALVAVSNFFPEGFDRSAYLQLPEEDQAWLLARASYCLESAGQLEKAENLRSRSNRDYQALEKWSEAAEGAEELAVLQTRLGKLDDALMTARKAVQWADRAAEVTQQEALSPPDAAEMNEKLVDAKVRQFATRSAIATILHRQGDLIGALTRFQEAETIHKESEHIHKKSDLPLHSVPGVRYCALLLDMAQNEEVLGRAEEMLKYKRYPLMDALHHLNKGRVLTELERLHDAWQELECALEGIRKYSKIQFTCQPLLARAAVSRTKNLENARADLQEVVRTGDECHMRLYEADAQLLLGHVELDACEIRSAREAFEKAGKLIRKHGYRLRFAELELLAARLSVFEGHTIDACQHLKHARELFEEIGHKRLRQQWEHIRNELDSSASIKDPGDEACAARPGNHIGYKS